jgi:hypothetical protein
MNECRQLPCIICSNLTPIQSLNTYGECETCAPIMNLKRTLEKQGKIVTITGAVATDGCKVTTSTIRLPHND